jgi:hypothetical protein
MKGTTHQDCPQRVWAEPSRKIKRFNEKTKKTEIIQLYNIYKKVSS